MHSTSSISHIHLVVNRNGKCTFCKFIPVHNTFNCYILRQLFLLYLLHFVFYRIDVLRKKKFSRKASVTEFIKFLFFEILCFQYFILFRCRADSKKKKKRRKIRRSMTLYFNHVQFQDKWPFCYRALPISVLLKICTFSLKC